MTSIPLSRSKGQRSRSPCRFTHCGLNSSGSCSGQRRNVLGVGNYCYIAVCFGAHRGRRWAGYIVADDRLQLVLVCTVIENLVHYLLRVRCKCFLYPVCTAVIVFIVSLSLSNMLVSLAITDLTSCRGRPPQCVPAL